MSVIERLTEYFSEFPGIGPRQSKRFVYFLLTKQGSFLEELAREILKLKESAVRCEACHRFFSVNGAEERDKTCPICRDEARDKTLLMVVEKDTDLESIERSRFYAGQYFVLGGAVPILSEKPHERIRLRELKSLIEKKTGVLKEVVLALSARPDGEYTADYLKEELSGLLRKHGVALTSLGRGLSTGSELEYADAETLKNALESRR